MNHPIIGVPNFDPYPHVEKNTFHNWMEMRWSIWSGDSMYHSDSSLEAQQMHLAQSARNWGSWSAIGCHGCFFSPGMRRGCDLQVRLAICWRTSHLFLFRASSVSGEMFNMQHFNTFYIFNSSDIATRKESLWKSAVRSPVCTTGICTQQSSCRLSPSRPCVSLTSELRGDGKDTTRPRCIESSSGQR